jgi:hypothetical protein
MPPALNKRPFLEYLAANGIDIFEKEIIRPFAEAGIWGAIRHHGLVGNAVIVSVDAGQFRVAPMRCAGHAERLLHKLMPATNCCFDCDAALVWSGVSGRSRTRSSSALRGASES